MSYVVVLLMAIGVVVVVVDLSSMGCLDLSFHI
jgi:hypothetical protein